MAERKLSLYAKADSSNFTLALAWQNTNKLFDFTFYSEINFKKKMYIFKEKYTVRYCKTLIFNWSLTRLGKMSCKSFLIKKNVSEHNAVGVSEFLCQLFMICLFTKSLANRMQ